MGSSDEVYDVIVLGAGSTGENVAARTVKAGLSTAIIESERAGGECSYWACMPSKTLLRPETVLASARRLPGANAAITGSIDFDAVMSSRNEAVSNYDDSSQVEWIESSNITFVRGHGRLDGERCVVVDTSDGKRVLRANRAVVLATGSSAFVPPIDGFDSIEVWTSREATSATRAPRRLGIIGGGVVAVEMAQAWKSLGTEQVILLVRGDRVLEGEEPFVSEHMVSAFNDVGIDVKLRVSVTRARKTEAGVELILDNGEAVVVDTVLAATGRVANTEGIGVETVGLEPGKPVDVDDHLRANGVDGNWLYAVGDVCGRAKLTHMGKYQARIAADVIAGIEIEASADHHAVPGVVFTEPQVASVGLRYAEARLAGLRAREVQVPWASVGAASVSGITDGVAHVVVDEDKRVLVGATFLGPEAGELLHAATIAIVGEVTLEQLWHAVPSYPTLSELWLRLLEEYGL